MFPPNFDYVCPSSITEAAQFLNEHSGQAKILAGGQSLIPILKLRLAAPQFVIDIGRLAELRRIEPSNGSIQIGSLVRHVDIEGSELLASACPLLPETAAEIGDVQVRNRGTLGGSLAHGDPSADFPAAVLALEAQLSAISVEGQRTVAADQFFTGLLTTALRPNEILTSVQIPKPSARTGSAYVKMHQQASGFAIVGVAAVITLNGAGKVDKARVGLTGVGPVPYRAKAVEGNLVGKAADADTIAAASSLATEGVDPLSDLHASSEYRRELAAVFTRRALDKAVQRARKQ